MCVWWLKIRSKKFQLNTLRGININHKKIIIIGAGIAGLAACTHLKQHGFEPTILEGRTRYGGRIWSDHTFGFPFGLGASWIHGDQDNPITMLAKQYHAHRVTVDPQKFIYLDQAGRVISQAIVDAFQVKFEALLIKVKQYAQLAETDLSLAAAFTALVPFEHFSSLEQHIFAIKLKLFESYFGANCADLSARHWDDEMVLPGENCFVIDTYQPIIDGLAKQCAITLNSKVSQIHLQTHQVEIIATDTVHYADAVIITLPLGVLKKEVVRFDPVLPRTKLEAIQRLGMGLYNITALKFPTAFWPAPCDAFFLNATNPLAVTTFFNLHQFIAQPILAGASGGTTALQLENCSDAVLMENIMLQFKKMFGANIPEPESFINTRWSLDPFSYGSYSYIAPDASAADFEELAKPIADRLFFAGEATSSQYFATTHGAYLSGIRAAERIIRVYKH